jgi:hypothetical protein
VFSVVLSGPTQQLSFQYARLLVGAQLNPIGGSEDPAVVPDAMPVANEQPVACFAGMTLARPVEEPLLHQVIVATHGCRWDDSDVIGCPSHDQRIEFRNDPRLWRGLQLLQSLLKGSQVTLARVLAGGDNGLAPLRLFLLMLHHGDFLDCLLANTETLELLQLAAHKMYWRMGENLTAFNTFWQALEEKLWSMESEPFSDLRYLMMSFQENGINHVETAIEKAKKAIHNELFSK